MNRGAFFMSVRASLFNGSLSQSQVDGMNAILDEWERRGLTDIRWLAYMLATAYWEAAKTMQPIREYLGSQRRYAPYYGRGLVQLTWDYNYRKAGQKLGLDLVGNPDLALELPNAVRIMFDGMIEGWFTGKKLADYLNAAGTDYVNARRIINGTDKAETISGFALSFGSALRAAAVPDMPTHDQPIIIPAEPKPPPKLLPRQPDDPGPEPAPSPPDSGLSHAGAAAAMGAVVGAAAPMGAGADISTVLTIAVIGAVVAALIFLAIRKGH